MQSLEKRNQSRGLGRVQTVSVSRHVAAALQHLANELVLGQPFGYRVERWPTLAALLPERVAVATLFALEDERALAFQRGGANQKFLGDGLTAPRVHFRTPGRMDGEIREGPKSDRNENDGEHRNRTPAPALFSFAEQKRKQNQSADHDHRTDEKRRRFHVRRKEGEHRVEPRS